MFSDRTSILRGDTGSCSRRRSSRTRSAPASSSRARPSSSSADSMRASANSGSPAWPSSPSSARCWETTSGTGSAAATAGLPRAPRAQAVRHARALEAAEATTAVTGQTVVPRSLHPVVRTSVHRGRRRQDGWLGSSLTTSPGDGLGDRPLPARLRAGGRYQRWERSLDPIGIIVLVIRFFWSRAQRSCPRADK